MGLVNYNKIRGFKFVKTSNNSVNAADLDGVIRARLLRLNPAMLNPLSIQGRGELGNQAWDDVDYVDLESDDDWIQKALSIKAGEDYDTRVSIPLDLPESELFALMRAAHERDITFNQLVEEALRAAIEDAQRDPEAFKKRADNWKQTHLNN